MALEQMNFGCSVAIMAVDIHKTCRAVM